MIKLNKDDAHVAQHGLPVNYLALLSFQCTNPPGLCALAHRNV